MSNIPIGTPTRLGSAEVLARGTEHGYKHFMHLDDGSYSLNTFVDELDWFQQFPTVVRTGNFVFCMMNRDTDGSNTTWHRPRYRLIDIVPDPEYPDRLGNNIAYPYITNEPTAAPNYDNYIPYHTNPATTGTWAERYAAREIPAEQNGKALEFSNNYMDVGNYPEGPGIYDTDYNLEVAVPIFENGRWVGCDQINENKLGHIWGVGDYLYPRAKGEEDAIGNKDFAYTVGGGSFVGTRWFFAPVVDPKQFATLYGEERIWGQPHASHDWLYVGYPDQTISGGRTEPKYPDGIPYYPFDMEIPITAGYGYTDTDEVKEHDDIDVAAIAGAAVLGAAIACNKDLISKATKVAEAELKNMASKAIAAGSTALLALQEKAAGVKDTLVANLPPIPEPITNLYDAITNLDLNDLKAVQFFKDKYGDLVDNVDDLLSKFKLPDFDICDLLSISHEKSPKPENPTTAPLEPTRNNAVPQVGASQPVTNDSGLTKENAEEANRTIDAAWKRVEFHSKAADFDEEYPHLSKGVDPVSAPFDASQGKEYYTTDEFFTDEYQSADIPRVIRVDPADQKEVKDLTDYILNGPQ